MRTLLLLLLLVPALCPAQIAIDGKVVLSGNDPDQRRVQGLAPSIAPADALSAQVAQSGVVHTAALVSGALWTIDLPAFGAVPMTGSHIVVEVPATDTSAINIRFNGHGPYPVIHEGTVVHSDALVPGTMLSLVLADGVFHVLNGTQAIRRTCPTDMAVVNDIYCIERTERGTGDYFQAGLACAAQGRRLCSWGEFLGACARTLELQLASTTDNWEWSNSTSNEDNSGRIMGSNSCEAATNRLSTGSAPIAFRCCLSR